MTQSKSILRVQSLNASLHKQGIVRKKVGIVCDEDDAVPFAVSFDTIAVREYERIVGDHPCVSAGPPIGIGWSYHSESTTSLDDYEKRKRSSTVPVLSRWDREQLLLEEWHIPRSQLVIAVRDSIRTKNQRRQSITTLQYAPFELWMENWREKLKKLNCLQRREATAVKHDLDKSRRRKNASLDPLSSSLRESSRSRNITLGNTEDATCPSDDLSLDFRLTKSDPLYHPRTCPE